MSGRSLSSLNMTWYLYMRNWNGYSIFWRMQSREKKEISAVGKTLVSYNVPKRQRGIFWVSGCSLHCPWEWSLEDALTQSQLWLLANGGGRDWAQSKSAKGIFSQDLILHPYQIWSLSVLWDCGLMLYFVIQALRINCQTPSTANTLAILVIFGGIQKHGDIYTMVKVFFHLWVVTSTA